MAVPVAGILTALQLLDALLARAGTISNLVKAAQSQGRDVTTAELDALVAEDETARAKLVAAITAAKQAPGT